MNRGPAVEGGVVWRPEYSVWRGIKARCTYPSMDAYPYYGGRGIKVCPRWRESFAAFLEDMGPRPSPAHSIERINGDGDYEPSNCCWASRAQQSRNRASNVLLTLRGETKTVAEWAVVSLVSQKAIYKRLERGWPPDRAVFEPSKRSHCEKP
jgi:hypothetical protein